MLDKVWKRSSAKKPAGRKMLPMVLGLSGAMWLGAAGAFFYLRDKTHAGGHEPAHGESAHAAEETGEAHDAGETETAELSGVPASAGEGGSGHAPEGAEAARHETEPAEALGRPGEGGHSESVPGKDVAEAHAAGSAAEEVDLLPTREEMDALRQVAELRAAAGQLEEAVPPLRRLLLLPTRDPGLLSLATRVFLGTANFAEAFRHAQQSLALAPDDMGTRVRMVEAQYRMGETEKAEQAALAALKEHPGQLEMLVQLGTMQVERGPGHKGYGQALAQALKLKPDYPPALYLQGRKAQLEGDFKDAETAFAKVVKSDPENAKARGQLGIAQYQLGKAREAEKSFRAALAGNPLDYNTWYNLGELLLNHANGETSSEAVRRFRAEAMECYLKAIELNPGHAQARYRVGVLLIGNGQFKEAIRHLETALRLDSRHVPTLVQLSLAYENLKQPERARAYLNKAYELDPLNKLVLFKLRRLS